MPFFKLVLMEILKTDKNDAAFMRMYSVEKTLPKKKLA